jgi:two-component system, NarL family, sensor histidine kinase BarA
MNHFDWNRLPIIDWELGKRLAGNQVDLAEDMMAMLKRSLPSEFAEIKNLTHQRDYSELLRHVHSLHGASAYCGTPRLKALLGVIEKQLRNQVVEEIDELVEELGGIVREMVN